MVDNFAKHEGREAKRRAISTFTRCVTKKMKDAEETLIRAHSITRIKTSRLAFESFQRRTRRFRSFLSSLSLSSFFFLPFSFFSPPSHSPSSPLVLAIGSFYHAPKARCSPPLYPHSFYRGLTGKIWASTLSLPSTEEVSSYPYTTLRILLTPVVLFLVLFFCFLFLSLTQQELFLHFSLS